jgi:sulfite reductase alpha subunit-like flavoprotein
MAGRGKGDDGGVDEEDDMIVEQGGKNLSYLVFGLGNKTYEHFNVIGRRTDKRLAALGATRVGPYGEGDDDGK